MANKAGLTWTPVDNARSFFAENAAEFRQAARTKADAAPDDEIEIDTEDLDADDVDIFGSIADRAGD